MTTPASAPTSPALIRQSKRGAAPPVTPVRTTKLAAPATAAGKLQQVGRNSSLLGRTPMTPAGGIGNSPASTMTSTPYTPNLSNRSMASSDASILATPPPADAPPLAALSMSIMSDNGFGGIGLDGSPEMKMAALLSGAGAMEQQKRARAPSEASNWRSRASQNGIRVSQSTDSQFADDEDSEPHCVSPTKSSVRSSLDANILPQPFLSTHRRVRSTTTSQNVPAVAPVQSQVPEHLRTPDRRKLAPFNALNTPPPKSSVVDRIKLKGTMTEPAQPRRRAPFGPKDQLFDIDENEYTPYAQSFSAAMQPLGFQDPFDVSLESIAEVGQDVFDTTDVEEPSFDAVIDSIPKACSVCDRATSRLAVLKPCSHPLCSTCLTGALNIVGEKDMRCSVCSHPVDDFKLQTFGTDAATEGSPPATSTPQQSTKRTSLLPSPFQQTNGSKLAALFNNIHDASTPQASQHSSFAMSNENIVLRIDNVPWDITPPAIAQWLKQPVEIVHVLLDRKGKTLSHAYVEVADEETFKAALRGAQNSVLGKGKRARGVTVTRSTQEELMRALFPSWQGSFVGSSPSVAGLMNDHAMSVLETGIITAAELNSLLHLIRSPDSHFLKVPSLPFHSLISLLAKFPANVDGQIPWSNTVRDMLFDIAFAAVQVMIPRVTDNQTPENIELLSRTFERAIACEAFTPEQSKQIADLLEHANNLPLNVSISVRPTFTSTLPQAADLHHIYGLQPSTRAPMSMPSPAPAPMNGLPGVNIGLGLPSGFSRGGLGNGVQLPIQHHLPSMPMQLPSMTGQSFLQMPMQSPLMGQYGVRQQDFRSMSDNYSMRMPPPGIAMPSHTHMQQQQQQQQMMMGHTRFDLIAREFGMDAQLVEALAHRLTL